MPLFRRKRKKKTEEVEEKLEAQPSADMSAGERAYLDQLQKSIATPGRSPYVERRKKEPPEPKPSTSQPVYDSGPMSAKEARARSETSIETEDGHISLGPDGVYHVHIDVPTADLDLDEEAAPKAPAAEETPRPKAREMPPPPPRPEPAPEPKPAAAKPRGMFPRGTLVLWDNDKLAVYVEAQEEKGYDLVYVVESGGRLRPKGVCLFAYDPTRVGLLSNGIYRWMEQSMQWDREALVCHLEDSRIADKFPVLGEPVPGDQQPAAANGNGPGNNGGKIVRGQTFTIHMGDNLWSGVYWGRDQLGTVVAHNTNRVWNLMHLDLKRFGTSIELGDILPEDQIREIETALDGTN